MYLALWFQECQNFVLLALHFLRQNIQTLNWICSVSLYPSPLAVSQSACFASSSPMFSPIRLFSYFQHDVKNGICFSTHCLNDEWNWTFFKDLLATQVFCSLYCCSYTLLGVFFYFFSWSWGSSCQCNLVIRLCNLHATLSSLCSLVWFDCVVFDRYIAINSARFSTFFFCSVVF